MKNYVHARLTEQESQYLKEVKKCTGETESEIIRKGLKLVYQKEVKGKKSALELAGDLVGCISTGIHDLSTNKKHMEGFGED